MSPLAPENIQPADGFEMGSVPGHEGQPVRQADAGDEDVLVADGDSLGFELRIDPPGIGRSQEINRDYGERFTKGLDLPEPFRPDDSRVQLKRR